MIIFVVIAMALGINPLTLLTGGDTSSNTSLNQSTLPPSSADTSDTEELREAWW